MTNSPSYSATSPSKRVCSALLIDDDVDYANLVKQVLAKHGFFIEHLTSLNDIESTLARTNFELVLLDLHLGPGKSGLSALPIIYRKWPQIPIYILTSDSSVDSAVEAIKLGANGYVEKTNGIKHLKNFLLRKHANEPSQLNMATGENSLGMVGTSKAFREVLKQVKVMADVQSNVLITGESGTGKELLAIVMTLKEYRKDLWGAKLFLYTDHKNLTFSTSSIQRVLQWRLFVDEFDATLT